MGAWRGVGEVAPTRGRAGLRGCAVLRLDARWGGTGDFIVRGGGEGGVGGVGGTRTAARLKI